MSHEPATPLNAIIGYSALLRDEAADTGREDQIPDLDKIHKAANHLLALIKDVLDLSKIEAGKMELFLEKFDLDAVIQNVAATVATLVAQNGNQLEICKSGELGWMWTDLTKLRQVLFNVLGNACKFTHEGRIELQVARTTVDGSDWISFAIKDNGIGMMPALVEKLFQDFTQGDESATRQIWRHGVGTGDQPPHLPYHGRRDFRHQRAEQGLHVLRAVAGRRKRSEGRRGRKLVTGRGGAIMKPTDSDGRSPSGARRMIAPLSETMANCMTSPQGCVSFFCVVGAADGKFCTCPARMT